MSNLDKWLQNLKTLKVLQERDIKSICQKAKEILINQPNVKQVRAPITVCGDIHGQFYDLLQLFEIGGKLPNTNYLFMGDYVDRGYHSVEVISYILILKIKHKDRITLLRGNHQNKQINKLYGFYEQCHKKYGNQNVWKMFTDVFQYLPLAATIEGQFFCLHGGLSPQFEQIKEVKGIDRFRQIPHEGIMCDLLWSDPQQGRQGFGVSPRQAGYIWGRNITQKFCYKNNLKMICRAHQLVMEGYNYAHQKKCVTVFSAPNYCYRCGNQASILQIDDTLTLHYHQYEPAPRNQEAHTTRRVPAYFL